MEEHVRDKVPHKLFHLGLVILVRACLSLDVVNDDVGGVIHDKFLGWVLQRHVGPGWHVCALLYLLMALHRRAELGQS